MMDKRIYDMTSGKMIRVNDFYQFIDSIKWQYEADQNKIKLLTEQNKKLRDEKYKDEELQKLTNELEECRKEVRRGFSISEDEEKSINEWKKKHELEKHGIKTDRDRIDAHGAIGGAYTYHFLPTSIGIVGEVSCSCGEKFYFRDLFD